MPLYEYELLETEAMCPMCPGRFGALQDIGDQPLAHCPDCGYRVRRVVSQVTIKTRGGLTAAKAAKKGLTTWKKTGEGRWEKVDGPGVDAIVGSPDDNA
ncbi:MAG: zinc ribbon domain-containing protein [Fimbriimonadaceae bacterium]|nr:zinc ribbon domain-containing protein [Fimbriimonadaceae bacterium]